jgi:hypothetical protein
MASTGDSIARVGPLAWTAAVQDAPPGLVYQFSVGSPGGPFQMVRDFSPDDHFTWTPMQEGTYRIRVTVQDGFAATDTESAVAVDTVESRVTGGEPVITPTSNPLVALDSVPPGQVGTVHVKSAVAGDRPSWQRTNGLPSLPSRSTNVFAAGMLPDTTYEMRDVFSDGTASAPQAFTTGVIPSTVKFPATTVPQPPGACRVGNPARSHLTRLLRTADRDADVAPGAGRGCPRPGLPRPW